MYHPPPYCDKGFTLAETLITLVIVGIVAALTIPNLIVKYQKEQTVTRLKKAYSSLNQAIIMAESSYGPLPTWQLPSGSFAKSDVKEYFIAHIFKYMQRMELVDKTFYYGYTNLSGYRDIHNGLYHYWIIFNDGSAAAVNCSGVTYCWIYYDINGQKKPNVLGKDIFMFDIGYNRNKIVFWDERQTRNALLNDSGYACSKSKSHDSGYGGGFCGALIQRDNWTISDDYPW